MPSPAIAIGVATVGTTIMGSNAQNKASSDAAAAQLEGTKLGIAESRRQFDNVQRLLAPYVKSGEDAISKMNILAGGGTPEEQQAAYQAIEDSPIFKSMSEQGEDAILQNASATGGVRGGNVQRSLGQFRPALLQNLIDEQYSKLSGLATIGQASAAGVGAAGQASGSQISSLYGEAGAARAGEALAHGQSQADLYSGIGKGVGIISDAYFNREKKEVF